MLRGTQSRSDGSRARPGAQDNAHGLSTVSSRGADTSTVDAVLYRSPAARRSAAHRYRSIVGPMISQVRRSLEPSTQDEPEEQTLVQPEFVQPELVQPELRVGRADDPQEREADLMADRVLRMPEPSSGVPVSTGSGGSELQRQVASEGPSGALPEEEEEELQRSVGPVYQENQEENQEENGEEIEEGNEEENEEETKAKDYQNESELSAKSEGDVLRTTPGAPGGPGKASASTGAKPASPGRAAMPAPAGFGASLSALSGGGAPLPQSERAFFEPRFATSFENVRLHVGPAADTLASSINARAFTRGKDIVFATGALASDRKAGRHLLAHELSHVVQQTRTSKAAASLRRYGSDVHAGETGRLAVGKSVGFTRQVADSIAQATQALDSGWTHPSLTSAQALELHEKGRLLLGRIQALLGAMGQIVGGPILSIPLRRYLRRRRAELRRSARSLVAEIRQKLDRSFSAGDVVHFPSRQEALTRAEEGINEARGSGVDLKDTITKFGYHLHRYQDSFSHGFPQGMAYSSLSKARHWLDPSKQGTSPSGPNVTGEILQTLLRSAGLFQLQRRAKNEEVLAKLLSELLTVAGAQDLFPDSTFGRGAVIRHVLLGFYPDDYKKNPEQGARDKEMESGTEALLKRFYSAIMSTPSLPAVATPKAR